MRAAFITGHGGNEVVEVGERPRPVRGPGEVLVRLRAATLNRVDLYMRDEVHAALDRLEAAGQFGKIAIVIGEP